MASTIAYVIFFSVVALIINYSSFKQYENRYIQKLIYFHKMIDATNLKTFTSRKTFESQIEFNNYPIPKVKDELLENHDYYVVVYKYKKRKSIKNKINVALLAIVGTSIASSAFS